MRTDKKKVNLSDTSSKYMNYQAKNNKAQAQQAAQMQQTQIKNSREQMNQMQQMNKQQLQQVQQMQLQQAKQIQKEGKAYRKDSAVRSSPILGTLIGLLGIGGIISTTITGMPIAITIVIGLAGGFGALMCKGPYDYTSLSAKFCAGSSILNLILTTIIFAFYLKRIGLLDFVFNITLN